MTKTISRFRIVPFTNPSRTQVFRVTGSTREGKQIRENFGTEAEATVRQQELEREYQGLPATNAQFVATKLNPAQVAEAEVAFHELGERSLMAAVRYYITNYREPAIRKPLATALKEFIAAKTASNNRQATIDSLDYKVGKFIKNHPDKCVDDIVPEDIATEIHRSGLSPISRSNIRRALHAFFEWCATRKPQAYCVQNPVKAVEPVKVDRDEPEILPLNDAKRLVAVAEEYKGGACIPYVILGLFCAIRPTELARLSWDDIDLKEQTVTIGAKLAKMRQRRIVEIPESAVAFLTSHAKDKTPIIGKNWRRDFDKVKSLAGYGGRHGKNADLKPWPADVMRHTGISYHLATYQHEGKTAAWAGNSPDVIQRHYKGLVRAKDATEFWQIQPAKNKIVQFQAA